MSEENIIEIRLTESQRIAFAAVLRAAHERGSQHQCAIFTVVTDSYVPDDQSSVLRLQVAMVDWRTADKVAKILTENAISIDLEKHFA